MINYKRLSIALIFCFILISCGIFGGSRNLDIGSWSPYQKANFFMTTWMSEKSSYDAMNAMKNKPEDLVKVLEAKYKILENSRVPIRTYSSIVNSGGTPDATTEDQIVKWLRELQIQYVYGGVK